MAGLTLPPFFPQVYSAREKNVFGVSGKDLATSIKGVRGTFIADLVRVPGSKLWSWWITLLVDGLENLSFISKAVVLATMHLAAVSIPARCASWQWSLEMSLVEVRDLVRRSGTGRCFLHTF